MVVRLSAAPAAAPVGQSARPASPSRDSSLLTAAPPSIGVVTRPLSAVSVNLGCASPSAAAVRRRRLAPRFLAELGDVDLVLAQEAPDPGEIELGDDFSVGPVTAAPSSRWPLSCIIWRSSTIEDRGPLVIPTSDYHRSYVSGRLLALPGVTEPVAVMSVHASPAVVSPEDQARWAGPVVLPRHGGGRDDGRCFDSDYVLETIRLVSREHPVLAAGDLNECLRWDETHAGETWGRLYFERLESYGLVPVLSRMWGRELPTYFGVGREPYQLDHVVATPDVAALISSAEEPSVPDPAHVADGTASDHASLRFTL